MNVKSTPGPWMAIGTYVGTDEEDFQTICYLSDHRNRQPRSHDEQTANGALIAAAPETVAERDRLKAANAELLAALKYIVEWNNETWDPEKARDLANAAIAKATGGE